MRRSTVLVVDDDPAAADLLRRTLDGGGFDVINVGDGASALDVAWNHAPDAIILDLRMPGIDGLEVCRRLRADRRTRRLPILMLSAQGDEADRVVGLELGADDYVAKPFSPREVLARVKTLLRRTADQHEPHEIIRSGPIGIDATRHEVSCDGRPVQLTATEFRVLHYLATSPGRVRSREEIIAAACPDEAAAVFDRTIDAHVKAIRRKLGPGGDQIETVRGFGYKLRDAK